MGGSRSNFLKGAMRRLHSSGALTTTRDPIGRRGNTFWGEIPRCILHHGVLNVRSRSAKYSAERNNARERRRRTLSGRLALRTRDSVKSPKCTIIFSSLEARRPCAILPFFLSEASSYEVGMCRVIRIRWETMGGGISLPAERVYYSRALSRMSSRLLALGGALRWAQR